MLVEGSPIGGWAFEKLWNSCNLENHVESVSPSSCIYRLSINVAYMRPFFFFFFF
jgi:hypothetical protein